MADLSRFIIDGEIANIKDASARNSIEDINEEIEIISRPASTTNDGLMSSADKTKLNGIENNANNYSLPTASASTKGGVKVGSNLSMSGEVLNAQDTTYTDATTTQSGLMSSTDKTKLNGIENNANNYSLPIASETTLGGVKVGDGLDINGSGVLSAGGVEIDIQDVYKVIGYNGAKNRLPYPYEDTTITRNGITFTDNGDGSITISGTSTDVTRFYLYGSGGNAGLKENIFQNMKITCYNNDYPNLYIYAQPFTSDYSSHLNLNDTNNGFVVPDNNMNLIRVGLYVPSGVTISNLTVKPMIRWSDDTDNTYQPYALTNQQLTNEIVNAESITLTQNANVTLFNYSAYKKNNMIYINGCWFGTITNQQASLPTPVFILPSGYTPSSTIQCGGLYIMDNDVTTFGSSINSDGQYCLNMYGTAKSGTFSVAYPI